MVAVQDYGAEGQFAYMQGECFETKIDKYTYRVCPFDKAVQVDGGRETSLGTFQKLAIASQSAEMQFANVRHLNVAPCMLCSVPTPCAARRCLRASHSHSVTQRTLGSAIHSVSHTVIARCCKFALR